MRLKASISFVLGLSVSITALYLSFMQVPFDELVNYLKSINYIWAIPSTLLVLAAFVIRVFRWQLILGSSQRVGFWQAFHPLMIGFMLNCILPGRVGEIARPVILFQKDRVPFSTGLATVAAERTLDVIILLLLFAWMMTVVRIDPAMEIPFAGYMLNKSILISTAEGVTRLSILLLAGIVMVVFEPSRRWMNKVILGIPKFFFFTTRSFQLAVRQRFCLVLISFIDNFSKGFLLIKDPLKMAGCFGLSLLIWGLSALAYYVMALGAPGIDLSLSQHAVVMIIVCLVISIPSAPGFWGIWEAGGVFGLALFGISAKEAGGFTLANHAVQMLPVIIVGIVSAIVTGVNVWHISRESQK